MAPLRPFQGPLRKLAIAMDVGTTYSGIAYAILDPGEVPKIQAVTRFPGQETGDFKIPSILWYTQGGKIRAAGAEARDSLMRLAAEDEDLVFVEWFKLHLRPKGRGNSTLDTSSLPPLPEGKTIVQILADFLGYLFECAKTYITETHPNGASLWESFDDRIDIILSHPNGWDGPQQAQMRRAAIEAGLVSDHAVGHARVHFVTEGEASLHYCVDSGLAATFIRDDATVMIVDAGGGTVDLSTYKFTSAAPISVEEIAPADCILQGSTRVNVRALEFLQAKLRNSRYGNDEDIGAMIEQFEKSTKPTFKDPNDRSFVKFGSMRDKDPDFGIRSGQLILEGHQVEKFFEPSISAIVDAIVQQRAAASEHVQNVFLVGGFAASPWLFARLKTLLKTRGIEVSRPDSHTNKAVAEGAASFFLEHFVSTRVARYTYGTKCVFGYKPEDPEHFIRRGKTFTRPSGSVNVRDGYTAILTKGTKIRESEESEQIFNQESEASENLNSILADITCYKGFKQAPRWTDVDTEFFSTLCTVHADTSKVARYRLLGSNGYYYRQDFKVVLSCGLTEMSAQISWMENGVEMRGPAKIIYDDDAAAC